MCATFWPTKISPKAANWQKKAWATARILSVPLLREGEPSARSCSAVRNAAFHDKQIELVTTFADQAVIAIENVRLFDEVQARTATSGVAAAADRDRRRAQGHQPLGLRSASRARHARRIGARLCDADMAAVTRETGDGISGLPVRTAFPPEARSMKASRSPESGSIVGRPCSKQNRSRRRRAADPEYPFSNARETGGVPHRSRRAAAARGHADRRHRVSRTRVRPFTDKQIELVTTFADQAVIAIENVRLFDEVQAKTASSPRRSTYQTATATSSR
jgi:two-component system NtrC family sensor kinase